MTNHWIDIKNSDCVLIMGSNAAENHPIFFRWAIKAKESGGKIINVDPRFTRTSQLSDIYCRIRPGTDIAFLGGMMNYVLQNKLYHEYYVREYTNASYIINSKFQTATELDGVFSGLENNKYNRDAWMYELLPNGERKRDMTLQNPQCVFQVLKRHYSRYTVDMVAKITGCDPKVFEEVCKTFGATGAPEKAGTIIYAMGTTQHTYGAQNVRAYSILQLLLGNMGIAGGGINALRGESNVQGSTDFSMLFGTWPGYNPAPTASMKTLKDYFDKTVPKTAEPKSLNWQGNRPKWIVSYLKAMYGGHATLNGSITAILTTIAILYPTVYRPTSSSVAKCWRKYLSESVITRDATFPGTSGRPKLSTCFVFTQEKDSALPRAAITSATR